MFDFALPQTGVLQEATNAPLLAWPALKVFDQFPDADFLQEIYEPLARWNEWWFDNNDDNHDGIVQINRPYMLSDDSPLRDEGVPVESPDFNTYLVMQRDAMARIAEIIGVVKLHPDIYEYYNPLTGMHPPKAAGIFGWTSAVYLDLAMHTSCHSTTL